MKTKSKLPLLSFVSGALIFIGFAGTISGSLAWWAYSTRTSLGFEGTSVASSEQLQVGIHVPDSNDDGNPDIDLTSLGMVYEKVAIPDGDEDSSNDEFNHYYFCDAGTGLRADVISYFLGRQGMYAIDKLIPVTSGCYSSDEDLQLKDSLVSSTPRNNNPAETKKYVKIPIAFKIMKYDSGHNLINATGENVWLSEAVAEASAGNNWKVQKAIRIFTSGKKAVTVNDEVQLQDSKLLINPSDSGTVKGSTAVAGLLDLSGDGYYDTYTKYDSVEEINKQYAIIYGQTTYVPLDNPDSFNEQTHLNLETVHQQGGDSAVIDFNNVGITTEQSTFVSKYVENCWHPSTLDSISPRFQSYDTLSTVKANDGNNGLLSGGKPVAATDLTTGIADLDLTIWLEGWDHNVIDKENQHSFNLGLQFQISRL